MKPQPELEVRTFRQAVEFRAAGSGPGVLAGYAAKYNKLSRNLGGFVEQVLPGAFDKSLADGVRVLARYNHETLLATTDAGSLRLFSDDIGLGYEIDLPDTTTGRDLAVLAARGDVRYSSFAFHVMPDGVTWGLTDRDFPLRSLSALGLVDVAPVDDPAYLDTTSALRSLADSLLLDFAEVRSAADRNELRDLMRKDVPGIEPSGDVTPPTPTDPPAEPRMSLDDARLQLAARAV